MKLAIMQPYFFPYIGYFQLIRSVDRFVVYDDVNFIKKGWINRNNLLVNGAPTLFTIPLKNASQNRLICEVELSEEHNWKARLLRTFELSYKKAPLFPTVFPLLENLINAEHLSVAALNTAALRQVCQYLEISTELVISSERHNNSHLKAQERILDICIRERADTYINPIGGRELYNPDAFSQHNIQLLFIRAQPTPYRQLGNHFQPNLSFLDCLMFLEPSALRQKLDEYELLA